MASAWSSRRASVRGDPPRKPGYYWIIIEEGTDLEIAHDGDDWVVVGREETVAPRVVLSDRLEPPAVAEPPTASI
jgi:hypothetical protein